MMPARANLCWLAVILLGIAADEATWPECPNFFNLRVIQPNTMDYHVTTLNLRHCRVSKIESLALNLPNLKAVYLDNNRFEGHALPEDLFQNCPQLKYIVLNGNRMTGAPEYLMQGLPALRDLWLESCSLQEVPMFAALPWSLENLYLSYNFIASLNNPKLFTRLSNLQELNLTHNRIEFIHADVFQPLINVAKISLSWNKIQRLDENSFKGLTSLVNLYLDNNEIMFMSLTMFVGCDRLEVLDLSKNLLTHLPENFISHLVNIRELYFDRNPWQCACLSGILVEIMKKGNIIYSRGFYDGRTPECVLTDRISRCHRHDECLPLLDKMTRSLAKYILK